jgi:chaperone modulatory protein CbpM
MRITSVVALFADLPEAELANWVARGWVRPDQGGADRGGSDQGGVDQGGPDQDVAGWEFHEIDVARVRLIHDLRRAMEIGEETMPVVLSLLDQVYELRGTLRDLLHALETQPAEVRTTVLAALRRE